MSRHLCNVAIQCRLARRTFPAFFKENMVATSPIRGLHQRTQGVIVACQRADGRWLFIRRSATVMRSPLRVSFPGGWIEPGETQIEAAVREMHEELRAQVEPIRCVWHYLFGEERQRTLWGWLARLHSPTLGPNPAEVHEILWLTAAEAVRHPDVVPNTDTFLAALLRATP